MYSSDKINAWNSIIKKTNPEYMITQIQELVEEYEIDTSDVINDYVHSMCISFFEESVSEATFSRNTYLLDSIFKRKKLESQNIKHRLTVFRLIDILKILYPSSDDSYYYEIMNIKNDGVPVSKLPFTINLMGIFINFIDNPTKHIQSEFKGLKDEYSFYTAELNNVILSSTYTDSELSLALTLLNDVHNRIKTIIGRLDQKDDGEIPNIFNVYKEITTYDDVKTMKSQFDTSLTGLFEVLKTNSEKSTLRKMKELIDNHDISFFLEPDKKMLNYFKLIN